LAGFLRSNAARFGESGAGCREKGTNTTCDRVNEGTRPAAQTR